VSWRLNHCFPARIDLRNQRLKPKGKAELAAENDGTGADDLRWLRGPSPAAGPAQARGASSLLGELQGVH
jgi:hypothetical protein